jgi:hypothetical protein
MIDCVRRTVVGVPDDVLLRALVRWGLGVFVWTLMRRSTFYCGFSGRSISCTLVDGSGTSRISMSESCQEMGQEKARP